MDLHLVSLLNHHLVVGQEQQVPLAALAQDSSELSFAFMKNMKANASVIRKSKRLPGQLLQQFGCPGC